MSEEKILRETGSLCPECKKYLKAQIFEKNNKVFIKKNCPVHGEFEDVYFGDAEMYKRFETYAHEGKGILNPNTTYTSCQFSCGLCNNHKTHTALLNLVVTNRCDSKCFYCFFYAKRGEKIYEPTIEEIREMLKVARNELPVPPIAIQLTGGNPELRDDLIEIVRLCKESGFQHIQLNSTGATSLYKDPTLVKGLHNAGVNTLYLSFDGVSKEKNFKNHWKIPYILENCRKAKLGVVLVPTIINGHNDDEIKNIINFALNNLDIVRGINFQPVSFVGSMKKEERERQRITISDIIHKIEEQSNGTIKAKDFFPVPTVTPISEFVEIITGKPQYLFSNHFICGAATYLFLDENKNIIPLPEFVDIDGLMKYLKERKESLSKNSIFKSIIIGKMLFEIGKFINKKKQPKDLNFSKLLFNVLVMHNYSALADIHNRSLFIGIMHFMDLYNYDFERVKRCGIHYVTLEGKIVPFCTFNVFPEIYRDKSQMEHSITVEEWEKIHNKNLNNEIKENIKELENNEIYRKTYGNLRDYL